MFRSSVRWEKIKPGTLSCIPPSQRKQKKKKKAFCFKGKVRRIGQQIFHLHNNINSYKKSNCNKRNWMLACTYQLQIYKYLFGWCCLESKLKGNLLWYKRAQVLELDCQFWLHYVTQDKPCNLDILWFLYLQKTKQNKTK